MRVIDKRCPRTGIAGFGPTAGRYCVKWHGGDIEWVAAVDLIFPVPTT